MSSTYGFERCRINSEEQAAHTYGDDLEAEILCQAAKKRALQKVTCSTHRLARTLLHRFHANTLDNFFFLSSPFVRMVLLRAHR